MQLGITAEKLEKVGVQTLAIVATEAERARLYFRFRPTRCAVGADPDLVTHRAYGLPQTAFTKEIQHAIESVAIEVARELRLPARPAEAYQAIDRLDGFTPAESDGADLQRHQAQFTGQFLVDRDGVVRWANIECAREGLAGIDKFPTDDELLAEAREL